MSHGGKKKRTHVTEPQVEETAARRVRRQRWFRVIAFLLPIGFLLAVEGVCRLRGYGSVPPLIDRVGSDGQRTWYAASRAGVASFFYRQVGGLGGMRNFAFATPKPADVVRIGLFGDSAMQGYPQPRSLTNGAFLEAALNDAWAGRQRAEVLNFGCTAVASYVSLQILREALEHELDVVVIMAGNNEYFGACGVASVHRAARSRLALDLLRAARRSGLVQWIDALLAPRAPQDAPRGQVLMERVAAFSQIGPDDPLRRAAAEVAGANLADMVREARQRGTAVIICSLPTNERDLAPIGVDIQPALAEPERHEFDEHLRRGESLLSPDTVTSESELRAALRLSARHARAHYLLGRALTSLGDDENALVEYTAARDMDTMPWRATSATNAAARQAAAITPGAVFCDMEAAFRSASPGGAIGWELMDDHVHMSRRGQYLFARSVVQAMTGVGGRAAVSASELSRLGEYETYATRLGANVFDEYAALVHVRLLFDAEFMRRTNPEAQMRVHARLDELRRTMRELDQKSVDEWADPSGSHFSQDRPINAVVATARANAGDFAGAAECYEAAVRSAPEMSYWSLQFAVDGLRCRERSRPQLDENDRQNARRAAASGELLRHFGRLPEPNGLRYLALAYHYAGDARKAAELRAEPGTP